LDQIEKLVAVDRPQDHSKSGDSRQSRRSARPFIILAIVLILLVAGGVFYWLNARQFATTNDAEIDGAVHRIASRIAGQVQTVLVHQNQHVTKGQVLVRLDSGTEQVALERAKAEAAQAAAQINLRQADATQAQANVAVASANLFEAQRNFNRYRAINPHAITRQQIDNATATLRAMTARVDAARQQVAGARASVSAAAAALKAARVAVRQAKLQLSYTEIHAPVAGAIAQRTVRSGNVVAAGAGLMAVVADRIWITANYKETELGSIRPGQAARVYVDAVPGIGFHAKVVSIQRGTGSLFSLLPAENATGNYVKVVQRVPVRLVFNDKRIEDYSLSPGMSAEPYIRIRPRQAWPY
jgi:membrane fusion protein (multidrug efflux system)